MEKNSNDKQAEGAADAAAKPKKAKVSIDPAQRGPGGFDKSILKGKKPIFRKQKKAGR